MKRRRPAQEEAGGPPPGPNLLVLAWRFIKTLVAVLLILYVAALVLSRTEGFKTLAEERLARALEAKVHIRAGHLTPGLDVVLNDLRLEETGVTRRAQATCSQAVIAWHLPPPLGAGTGTRVTLRGAKVLMAWQNGAWYPRGFQGASAMVASWLQIPVPGEKKKGSGKMRPEDLLSPPSERGPVWTGPRVRVEVSDGQVQWWTDESNPAAEVTGLRLTVTPLDAPDRKMTHYLLEARQVSARGESLAAPLRLESLDVGGQQVMLGMMAGQEPAAPPR